MLREKEKIKLPSNGLCYPLSSKLRQNEGYIEIYYMLSKDENYIDFFSQDKNTVITQIIQRLLVDKDIKADDLCDADREAILLWVRKTSYGDSFKINIKIDENNFEEHIIKLDDLEFNEIIVPSDENGHFYYFINDDILLYKILNFNDFEKIKNSKRKQNHSVIKSMIVSVNDDSRRKTINSYVNKMKNSDKLSFLTYTYNNSCYLKPLTIKSSNTNESINVKLEINQKIFL